MKMRYRKYFLVASFLLLFCLMTMFFETGLHNGNAPIIRAEAAETLLPDNDKQILDKFIKRNMYYGAPYWYRSLFARGYNIYDCELHARTESGNEVSFPISTIGYPSLYIMPMACIFSEMNNPNCYRDVKFSGDVVYDASYWGVDSQYVDRLHFSTFIYCLPGAKVPEGLLNPIYSGFRTKYLRSIEMMPTLYYINPAKLSPIRQPDDMPVRVILFYARLDVETGILIRESVNIYDKATSSYRPAHCFDFIYDDAKDKNDAPVRILLKIFPNPEMSVRFLHYMPTWGKGHCEPGEYGVNYEYSIEYRKIKSSGKSSSGYNDVWCITSVNVVEQPLPDFFGPNSIFFTSTQGDAIKNVWLDNMEVVYEMPWNDPVPLNIMNMLKMLN